MCVCAYVCVWGGYTVLCVCAAGSVQRNVNLPKTSINFSMCVIVVAIVVIVRLTVRLVWSFMRLSFCVCVFVYVCICVCLCVPRLPCTSHLTQMSRRDIFVYVHRFMFSNVSCIRRGHWRYQRTADIRRGVLDVMHCAYVGVRGLYVDGSDVCK